MNLFNSGTTIRPGDLNVFKEKIKMSIQRLGGLGQSPFSIGSEVAQARPGTFGSGNSRLASSGTFCSRPEEDAMPAGGIKDKRVHPNEKVRLVIKDLIASAPKLSGETLVILTVFADGYVPILINLLENKEPKVRLVAATALGKIAYADDEAKARARDAIPALQEISKKDPSPEVRDNAVQALKKIQRER